MRRVARLLLSTLLAATVPATVRAEEDSPSPMQRRATEASAERLLDDSLLDNPERRARNEARLAEPVPAEADPAALAEFFYARGNAAVELGRQVEALKAFARAAELVSANHPLRTDIFYGLAQTQANLGRIGPSIAAYREANQTVDGNHRRLRNLALIAEGQARLGDADGARRTRAECSETVRRAASDRADRNPTAQAWRRINELRCDIAVLIAEGRLAEADPLIRRVIANYEEAPNTRGTYIVGNRYSQLAENLRRQGRPVEAENEARTALHIFQTTVGATSQRTGSALVQLGRIIADQGRLKEGEALARKGIEVMKASGNPGRGASMGILADILAAQYRWAEAREAFTEMRDGFAGDAEGLEAFIRNSPNYALALLKTGAADQALELFVAARRDFAARLGEDHYSTALAGGLTAAALAALGREDEALEHFARAVPPLIAASDDDDEENGNAARDRTLRLILEAEMALLVRRGGDAAVEESFRLAETARGRSVQRALAASAVRVAAGDPSLAEPARRAQDAEKRISALNGLLADAISARAQDLDTDSIGELKKRIARLKAERADDLKLIAERFPEFGRLSRPQPATPTRLRGHLRPGEALAAFYSTEDTLYTWAVPADGPARVSAAPLGRVALEAKVKRLRDALDVTAAEADEIPEFDLGTAWSIYAAALAPTEAAWTGARTLFTVPHGPLGLLPLAVLPTAPPPAALKGTAPFFAKYREVPWLARRTAVAQLPSAASLITLRNLPEHGGGRRSFLAFADPLFAKAPSTEPAPVERRGIGRRAVPARGDGLTAELARLPRLPDTADEVLSIARVLGADPERDVFLRARAGEGQVRRLDLTGWRVVMFATHGLIPGDLPGLDQPALALSNPEVTGDGSSGLLTAESIMGLKLDADWVVLSACNTAAGDGAGAEAASGLGRAFFYAGARALLVTNWPVETVSARLLTTDLFRRQAQDPSLSRARALRDAMLALMDGSGPVDRTGRESFTYAHPTFWAPYSLVGDGG